MATNDAKINYAKAETFYCSFLNKTYTLQFITMEVSERDCVEENSTKTFSDDNVDVNVIQCDDDNDFLSFNDDIIYNCGVNSPAEDMENVSKTDWLEKSWRGLENFNHSHIGRICAGPIYYANLFCNNYIKITVTIIMIIYLEYCNFYLSTYHFYFRRGNRNAHGTCSPVEHRERR